MCVLLVHYVCVTCALYVCESNGGVCSGKLVEVVVIEREIITGCYCRLLLM